MTWPPKRSPFAVALGEVLVAARHKAGLTQLAVAEHAGVIQAMVSRWERGVALPNVEHFVSLIRLLDISLDDIEVAA